MGDTIATRSPTSPVRYYVDYRGLLEAFGYQIKSAITMGHIHLRAKTHTSCGPVL